MCLNNTCGGVCGDSWSEAKSQDMCQSVDGCGHYIRDLVVQGDSRQRIPPLVKSLHFHPVFGKSLVMNEGSVCMGSAAVVTCSGEQTQDFFFQVILIISKVAAGII